MDKHIRAFFLIPIFILPACVSQGPLFPTPTFTPTTTPTICSGPYTWSYGKVPLEFTSRLQAAMKAANIDGTAQATTFGEYNGCTYGAMNVDYTFTVQIASFNAAGDLTRIAASLHNIATHCAEPCPAPNLGNLGVVFQSQGKQCQWMYASGAWQSLPARDVNEIACPVPTPTPRP